MTPHATMRSHLRDWHTGNQRVRYHVRRRDWKAATAALVDVETPHFQLLAAVEELDALAGMRRVREGGGL